MRKCAVFLSSSPLLVLIAFCLLTGCHVQATTPPTAPLLPGAANLVDQDLYKALMGVQGSIDSLKVSIAANPALSVLTPAVNQLIKDYNIAQVAWGVEHSVSTPANQAAVQTALTKAQTDASILTKAVQ